jgi:hypothetical protein
MRLKTIFTASASYPLSLLLLPVATSSLELAMPWQMLHDKIEKTPQRMAESKFQISSNWFCRENFFTMEVEDLRWKSIQISLSRWILKIVRNSHIVHAMSMSIGSDARHRGVGAAFRFQSTLRRRSKTRSTQCRQNVDARNRFFPYVSVCWASRESIT